MPAVKLLYATITCGFQHSPAISGVNVFLGGLHCTHMNMAPRYSTTFTERMMSQISQRILPSEMRSSVMAKLVLLQAVPRMDQKPVIFMMRRSLEKEGPSVVTFQLWWPNPIVVDMEPKMPDITSVSYR